MLYFSNDEIAFTDYKESEQTRVCCSFFCTLFMDLSSFFSSLPGDGSVDVWNMNADGEKWSEVDKGVMRRNWDDLKGNAGGLNEIKRKLWWEESGMLWCKKWVE